MATRKKLSGGRALRTPDCCLSQLVGSLCLIYCSHRKDEQRGTLLVHLLVR